MSMMQAIWSHPDTPLHNSSPTAHPLQMHAHHFHFPPTGLRAASASFSQHLRAEGRKLSHTVDGKIHPAGPGSITSWSPNTDICQTKLAYHIEIEVPGTTDKETLSIQWLSPSTLVVRGDTGRPFVGRDKAAPGAYEGEQGKETGNDHSNGHDTREEERAQDGTHGHDVGGGGMSLYSGIERVESLKQNEHDGKHVPQGFTVPQEFTYQTSTGGKHVNGGKKKTENDGGELKRMITDPTDVGADVPMFLLKERKTGPWLRTFTLPHNIDMEALKARLLGGLLVIDVPIQDAGGEPVGKVEIE